MAYLQYICKQSALLKLVLICVFFITQFCESDAKCKLMVSNAFEENLLQKLAPLNGRVFHTKDANNTYNISICDKMDGQDVGIGAVQYAPNGNFTLGRYDKVEIIGGTNWMMLKYYGGQPYHSYHCSNGSARETHIMIICDPDVLADKLEIIEERDSSLVNCFYLFELGSNVSCSIITTPNKKGYSSGSVFCIIFFTLAIMYLAVGFLYKRLVVGAKGFEQIPNYTFWKDFGNLQADGCDYICRCGPRQEAQTYRGIDDHLKMEDERDDQLLNM